MYSGRIIFSQLFNFLPRYEFNKCVDRYQGNRRVRNFFQMDQTAPSHQIVFWNVTKRREDANLDCHHCLRPRIHYEKETKNQSQSYGNPTNFEHCSFRENPYKTSLGERSLEN